MNQHLHENAELPYLCADHPGSQIRHTCVSGIDKYECAECGRDLTENNKTFADRTLEGLQKLEGKLERGEPIECTEVRLTDNIPLDELQRIHTKLGEHAEGDLFEDVLLTFVDKHPKESARVFESLPFLLTQARKVEWLEDYRRVAHNGVNAALAQIKILEKENAQLKQRVGELENNGDEVFNDDYGEGHY